MQTCVWILSFCLEMRFVLPTHILVAKQVTRLGPTSREQGVYYFKRGRVE